MLIRVNLITNIFTPNSKKASEIGNLFFNGKVQSFNKNVPGFLLTCRLFLQ